MKIAVVSETNQEMAGFLTTALKRRFDKVLVASTTTQVWQWLTGFTIRPALVLIDLNEQAGMGLALLQRIRQTDRLAHLPVVLIVAGESRRRHYAALENAQTRLLAHPFTYQELNTTIDALTQSARFVEVGH